MGLIKLAKYAIIGGLIYYGASYGCNALKKADYEIRNKAPKPVVDVYNNAVKKGKEAALDFAERSKEKLKDKIDEAYEDLTKDKK